MRSVSGPYNEDQLPLRESLETAVTRIEVWCEMAASLRGTSSVGRRYQAAQWRPWLRKLDFVWFVKCSRELCVEVTNKSDYQFKTASIVTYHVTVFLYVELHYWKINTLFLLVGWDFGYCGHYWPIVPAPDGRWWWLWRNWWNENLQGKSKYSEKTCSSATLSTTNPTWIYPGLNPGRRGGKQF
jgi:hypothetical protein